jgi:hypothetical protein
MTPVRLLPVGLALALLLSPRPVRGNEWYFVLVFSSQSTPKLPRYTHTFATVVKVTADGRDPSQGAIESVTISWLPATLQLKALSLKPEPGVNLNLYETLHTAMSQGQRVTRWGPYQTDSALYEAALSQAARLAHGELGYRALDPLRQGAEYTDCIHSVLDLDPRLRRTYRPEFWLCGDEASARVVRDLIALGRIPWPGVTHDWLNARLGLDAYPIRQAAP